MGLTFIIENGINIIFFPLGILRVIGNTLMIIIIVLTHTFVINVIFYLTIVKSIIFIPI